MLTPVDFGNLEEQLKDREFRQAFYADQTRCDIALWLRRSRERMKLTQSEVAERAGCKQSEVARAENPDRGITIATLTKIADGLGLIPVFRFKRQ